MLASFKIKEPRGTRPDDAIKLMHDPRSNTYRSFVSLYLTLIRTNTGNYENTISRFIHVSFPPPVQAVYSNIVT